MAVATIKFVEGFASAIRAKAENGDDPNSVLVVAFRNIPEGVTVTPSLMGTGKPMEDDGSDLAPLHLLIEGEMSGA